MSKAKIDSSLQLKVGLSHLNRTTAGNIREGRHVSRRNAKIQYFYRLNTKYSNSMSARKDQYDTVVLYLTRPSA